jgi:pimeloyl-ACP methyl ester carboxylesterase
MPVVLVGHSMGGVTARVLQQLLHERAFPGFETSARWVSALVTLSSPHNGDPVVHALGSRAREKRAVEREALAMEGAAVAEPRGDRVRFGSCGYMLGTLIHLIAFLDVPWLPGVKLEHWRLSRTHGLGALQRLVTAVANRSAFISGEDNLGARLYARGDGSLEFQAGHISRHALPLIRSRASLRDPHAHRGGHALRRADCGARARPARDRVYCRRFVRFFRIFHPRAPVA